MTIEMGHGHIAMDWDPNLEINLGDRRNSAIRCAGCFGARLRAGNVGAYLGDSIMIDPARGFFAVGDSSDRDPRAARVFMLKFSEILDEVALLSNGAPVPEGHLDALMREVVERARAMLREFPFKGTTTFTGVLIIRTPSATKALLIHTGDSILLSFNPESGLRTITEKNFWLIGKTREFYQVALFDVRRGDRFLFASDGLMDLTAPAGQELYDFIGELFRRHPVADIPDLLIKACQTKAVGRDDLAILTLVPDKKFPPCSGIILGE